MDKRFGTDTLSIHLRFAASFLLPFLLSRIPIVSENNLPIFFFFLLVELGLFPKIDYLTRVYGEKTVLAVIAFMLIGLPMLATSISAMFTLKLAASVVGWTFGLSMTGAFGYLTYRVLAAIWEVTTEVVRKNEAEALELPV